MQFLAHAVSFAKVGREVFCLYVVPSLDLVIYKLGGKDGQYDEKLTRILQPRPTATVRTGNPSPALASTKAASLATMVFGACWKWCAPQCGWSSRITRCVPSTPTPI